MLRTVRTALFVLPVNENVHGANLGPLLIRPVEPEHLLAAMLLHSLIGNVDGRSVVADNI